MPFTADELYFPIGLTPQYKDLQALHEKYGDKGLAIIGFPCNQVSVPGGLK